MQTQFHGVEISRDAAGWHVKLCTCHSLLQLEQGAGSVSRRGSDAYPSCSGLALDHLGRLPLDLRAPARPDEQAPSCPAFLPTAQMTAHSRLPAASGSSALERTQGLSRVMKALRAEGVRTVPAARLRQLHPAWARCETRPPPVARDGAGRSPGSVSSRRASACASRCIQRRP